MTDKKIITPPINTGNSSLLTKGYVPQPIGNIQGGYQGPTGQTTAPPTTGTSVQPPATPPAKK